MSIGRRTTAEKAVAANYSTGDAVAFPRDYRSLGVAKSDERRVAFRLGDGETLELGKDDPQLRHLDNAWASTVHAFQGRTIDNVIAVMEAKH